MEKQRKLTEDRKTNYVDAGIDSIFGNQMVLKIENKMREISNFDKKSNQWNEKLRW